MTIIVKNKQSLFFDDFNFKCCIGKKGLTENKIEGDKKTPKGLYSLGNLYYRGDKVRKASIIDAIDFKEDGMLSRPFPDDFFDLSMSMYRDLVKPN